MDWCGIDDVEGMVQALSVTVQNKTSLYGGGTLPKGRQAPVCIALSLAHQTPANEDEEMETRDVAKSRRNTNFKIVCTYPVVLG